MSKTIKSSQIEMPPHLGTFPKEMPAYQVDHPIVKNQDPRIDWESRMKFLKNLFQFDGFVQDIGDRFVLQDKEGNQVIQIYKASSSFLYYDRRILTPTDRVFSGKMLGYETAKLNAHDWLGKYDLMNQHLFFEGMAYTGVTVAERSEDRKNPYDFAEDEYHTEIKPCFGFKIDETNVLGPGAKVMISYAGNEMSQVVYFWRRPWLESKATIPILPPVTIKKHLARDPRFSHLNPNHSKIRINNIRLGYYAASPADFQRYYLPTYQFTGIVETRGGHNATGFEAKDKKKGSMIQEDFQYNFNFYLPAIQLTPSQHKMSGFPVPLNGSAIF